MFHFNKANQRYSFFYPVFKKIGSKMDKHCCSTKALNLIFFLTPSKFNSHVHEPSKLVENVQYFYTTTERKLTSKHCLKLKSLGFSVLKYSRLPMTRTSKGNRKNVRVIGSSKKIAESKVKDSFYCTVDMHI